MSAAALTPLAMSALALLCERPMHPYEMYRLMIERREDDLVKVRPGTLYHSVARMAELELVEATGTDREGGRPERTTYQVTARGRQVLEDRIRVLLAEPVNEYPSFPVALGEAVNLPPDEVRALLGARIHALEAKLAKARIVLDVAVEHTEEIYLMDRYFLIDMTTAELDSLRKLVARIESEELQWPFRTAQRTTDRGAKP